MQFVGKTCDEAVMVHPGGGVGVGDALHALHRLLTALGGSMLAAMSAGVSSTL
jgi:hypothetical protein